MSNGHTTILNDQNKRDRDHERQGTIEIHDHGVSVHMTNDQAGKADHHRTRNHQPDCISAALD